MDEAGEEKQGKKEEGQRKIRSRERKTGMKRKESTATRRYIIDLF